VLAQNPCRNSSSPSVVVIPAVRPREQYVTFVTTRDLVVIRGHLDALSRAFAEAAGFAPKTGRHVFCRSGRRAIAGVLFCPLNRRRILPRFAAGPRPCRLAALGHHGSSNTPHDGTTLAATALRFGSYRSALPSGRGQEIRLIAGGRERRRPAAALPRPVGSAPDLNQYTPKTGGSVELQAAAQTLSTRQPASFSGDLGADSSSPRTSRSSMRVGRAVRPCAPPSSTWLGIRAIRKDHPDPQGRVLRQPAGLDIKNYSGMLNIKKDMASAGNRFWCASPYADDPRAQGEAPRVLLPGSRTRFCRLRLPSRVRHLRSPPCAELSRSVSRNAEGRLILADALTLATMMSPSSSSTMATQLTGASPGCARPLKSCSFYKTDLYRLAAELARSADVSRSIRLWRLRAVVSSMTKLLVPRSPTSTISLSGGFAARITRRCS